MDTTSTETTRTVRTATGTKLHIAYVYADGGLGRYAACGADTQFGRGMDTDATCKRCTKRHPDHNG